MHRNLTSLLSIFFPLGALAQSPAPPTIRIGTQIVLVDVTVTDSHGTAVHHLKQSDFNLLEDNTLQTISHFGEHNPPSVAELAKLPPMPRLEPNTFTNFTFVTEGSPLNVLLIDTLNTQVNDQANSRQKLIAFVKGMKPGTSLAIFDLSTRLTLLQGLTSDPKLLLAAVSRNANVRSSPILSDPLGSAESVADTVRIPSATIKDAMQQTEAKQSSEQNRFRVLTTLGAMNQLARYLSGLPGRKNLIWISGSFPLSFLPNRGFKDSFQIQIRETANLLAHSQVAIYPVDSRGIQNTPLADASAGRYALGYERVAGDVDTFSTQHINEQETMRQLAEATGGKAYLNNNDIKGAVEKSLDNGSSYYTLIYSPNDKSKEGYRKITLHLASGKYDLSYRDGYYVNDSSLKSAVSNAEDKRAATPPIDAMRIAMQRGAPPPSQILFKALFVSDIKRSDKPAKGNIATPKSKPPYRLITIAYAASPSDISMPARPDGLRHVNLDFVALVYDRDGQLFTQQTDRVDVFAKPEAIQDFVREGVRYQQQIAVPAKGEFYLRSGIHDLIGDKIGAIEVPTSSIEDTRTQLTGPLSTEGTQKPPPSGRPVH